MAFERSKDPRTVGIQIRITPKQKDQLGKRATDIGISDYAQLIFDAAYAARIGLDKGMSAGDRDLDEQCRLVFALAGQADTASIARATGVPEPLVVRILDAWKTAAPKPTPNKKGKRK